VTTPLGITYLDLVNAMGDSYNLLLVSGQKGYGEVILSGGNLIARQDPGSNATYPSSVKSSSQYSSTLEKSNILSIWALTPVIPNSTYVIYAAGLQIKSAQSEDNGLWSYYGGTSNEWNRD
jgi:hypothetical protein